MSQDGEDGDLGLDQEGDDDCEEFADEPQDGSGVTSTRESRDSKLKSGGVSKKSFLRSSELDTADALGGGGSVESGFAEDGESPSLSSACKKSKNRKKRTKKIVKDQDLQLLSEYAQTIKYSSDTQICDINRNRKNNKEFFNKPKLYCAKQLLNQNKNIIVSINGPLNHNNKENCFAPVIYDQGLSTDQGSTQLSPSTAGKA